MEALITALAPEALGTVNPGRPPAFLLDTNFVEALSYVGAVALVLVVVAVASPVRARGLLPRGVWLFLVAAVGLTVVMTFGGGPLLAAAQKLPVLFSENYVGRLRSVLGFLLAVLAATGFEVVLRGRGDRAERPALLYGAAVWVSAAAGTVWIWSQARAVARAADTAAADDLARLYLLDREVLAALALVAIAILGAAVLRWVGGGRVWHGLRLGAAMLLPALIAVQALGLVRDYWPRSDRDTFYPVTDTQRFLQQNLGHERYAFALDGMGIGADIPLRLRALDGHIFVNDNMSDLIEALPGEPVRQPADAALDRCRACCGHQPGARPARRPLFRDLPRPAAVRRPPGRRRRRRHHRAGPRADRRRGAPARCSAARAGGDPRVDARRPRIDADRGCPARRGRVGGDSQLP